MGIYPSNDFRVHCMVDYAHPAIGRQEIELVVNRHTFRRDAGPGRAPLAFWKKWKSCAPWT